MMSSACGAPLPPLRVRRSRRKSICSSLKWVLETNIANVSCSRPAKVPVLTKPAETKVSTGASLPVFTYARANSARLRLPVPRQTV
ncbi:hypothetical protein D3C81_1845630 [compost metagenome]